MNYEELLKKYPTPLYMFDIEELHKRIAYLKSKFNKEYNLVYAIKANTFIAKELENDVSRYEICSNGEFEICDNLNIDHSKMVISGVNKDIETIEEMIKDYDNILKYTIESMTQYELLNTLCEKYQKKIHVLIRLTSGNQFGVSEEDFQYIIKNNNANLITIDGIEYFSGTQKHSLVRIEKEIDYLIEFLSNIEKNFNIELKEVEYGPGLPVFYYKDDIFNEDEFLEKLNQILNKFENKIISIEIGRSIAASCGKYFTKVVDLKENKNGNFAILDGGINHLVYYGQTMAMKIPKYEIISTKKGPEKIYNLCGSLCTVNDFLVKNIKTNELNKNDIFVFKNVGAYSYAEGISLFLSRDLPRVILKYENNNFKEVRDAVKTSTLNFPNY